MKGGDCDRSIRLMVVKKSDLNEYVPYRNCKILEQAGIVEGNRVTEKEIEKIGVSSPPIHG